MVELSLDVTSKEVTDVLTRIAKRMGNLKPVMGSIGQELESRVSARFETRTDPNGRAWAPWAPSTRDNYPKDGHGKLLDRYGDMLRSLSHSAGKDSVLVGFGAAASKAGDAVATYHEFGTWKMPRRGLLTADPDAGTLSVSDETAVLDVLYVWLNEAIP